MDAPYVATATTECELWFLSYKVSASEAAWCCRLGGPVTELSALYVRGSECRRTRAPAYKAGLIPTPLPEVTGLMYLVIVRQDYRAIRSEYDQPREEEAAADLAGTPPGAGDEQGRPSAGEAEWVEHLAVEVPAEPTGVNGSTHAWFRLDGACR